MQVRDILKARTAISFEVFPPKTEKGMETLCAAGGVLEQLYSLEPDYISCTYGAGGSNVGRNLEVLKKIRADDRTLPVTHFTCVGSTKEEIRAQLQTYLDEGIDNILALRGDLPPGWTGTGGDLHYATELVKFIRREFGHRFCIGVAGTPEGHIGCRSLEADIAYLRQKQDNGADYIVTQICWDMERFQYWFDAIRRAGITVPVCVGILPVVDSAQTIRLALSRNATVMPRKLCEIISRHWIFPDVFSPGEDEEIVKAKKAAFMEEGIAYTVRQIDVFRSLGVNGLHLYALNKYEAVARIIKESGIIDYV